MIWQYIDIKSRQRFWIVCLFFLGIVLYAPVSQATQYIFPELKYLTTEQQKAARYLKEGKYDKVIQIAENILHKTPDDLQAHLLVAIAYLGKGDDHRAIIEAESARKINAVHGAVIYANIARYYSFKKAIYKALLYYEESLKIQKNTAVIKEIASIYMARGQIEIAKTYYEQLLEQDRDYINLSRICLMQKDFQSAIFYAEKAAAKDEHLVGAYIILGSSHLMSNNLKQAEENFLTVKDIDPKFYMADYYLGLIQICRNRYDDALINFDNLIKVAPKIKEAHLASAAVWHLKGDLDKAQASALKAVTYAPEDHIGQFVLGNIYYYKGELKLAEGAFRKADTIFPEFGLPEFQFSQYFIKMTSSEAASLSLGVIYFREGLFFQGQQAIASVISKASSESPFFYLMKARFEYKIGDVINSQSTYRRVIDTNPELISSYIDLGNMAIASVDVTQAIQYYEKAASITPGMEQLQLRLGDLYFKNGNRSKAIARYRQAIALSPRSVDAYNQLAWILSEKNSQLDEALSFALKGSGLAPEHVNMTDTLGWIYYRKGMYEKALNTYSNIAQLPISNPGIYYRIGLIYQKLNDDKKARELFEHALNISDEFPESDNAKKVLDL